jgi:hypothetical protein
VSKGLTPFHFYQDSSFILCRNEIRIRASIFGIVQWLLEHDLSIPSEYYMLSISILVLRLNRRIIKKYLIHFIATSSVAVLISGWFKSKLFLILSFSKRAVRISIKICCYFCAGCLKQRWNVHWHFYFSRYRFWTLTFVEKHIMLVKMSHKDDKDLEHINVWHSFLASYLSDLFKVSSTFVGFSL